jgi:hypothetical protein
MSLKFLKICFQKTILLFKHVTYSFSENRGEGVYHKNKIKGGD